MDTSFGEAGWESFEWESEERQSAAVSLSGSTVSWTSAALAARGRATEVEVGEIGCCILMLIPSLSVCFKFEPVGMLLVVEWDLLRLNKRQSEVAEGNIRYVSKEMQ